MSSYDNDINDLDFIDAPATIVESFDSPVDRMNAYRRSAAARNRYLDRISADHVPSYGQTSQALRDLANELK